MSTHIPAAVRIASTCLAMGSILLFLFSFFMIAGGAFVGLHILLPGVVMFGLGVLGMSASLRIDKQRPFSRMMGLMWGGVVATGTAAMIHVLQREPDSDMAAVIMPATFTVLAVCVLVSLLLPSTSRWLAVTKEPADSHKER